jgi:hypothetical protein
VKLVLQRDISNAIGTQGSLTVDGHHVAFTLERPAPQFQNEYHCIPAGTYKISIYDSPRFGRLMPLLDVPGHSGIEIHWGSFVTNSHGCILVGKERGENCIFHTREKFDELFLPIQAAAETEGCSIEVRDVAGPSNHEDVQNAVTAT